MIWPCMENKLENFGSRVEVAQADNPNESYQSTDQCH